MAGRPINGAHFPGARTTPIRGGGGKTDKKGCLSTGCAVIVFAAIGLLTTIATLPWWPL